MDPHPSTGPERNAPNVSSSASITVSDSRPPVLARVPVGVRESCTEQDDAQLFALLERDPSAGMAHVYDRYSRLVYGIARAILGSGHEAEDLTQEVFVALLDRCGYDPLRGSFAGYLTTFTRSRAID